MPSAFRSASTVTTGSPGHTSLSTPLSLGIAAPAGIEAGDLLVLGWTCASVSSPGSASMTTTSGWTNAATSYVGFPGQAGDIWYKVADASDVATATYTINLGVAKKVQGAIMGCWNHNVFNAGISTISNPSGASPGFNKSLTLPSVANSVLQRIGVIVAMDGTGNSRKGQVSFAGSGWTTLAQDYVYAQSATGAGENAQESHLNLLERADDDTFDAMTMTATFADASDASGDFLHLYEVLPDIGYTQARQGGTAPELPLRKFISHNLPYDIRTVKLRGARRG